MTTSSLFSPGQLKAVTIPRKKAEPKVYGLNDVLPFGKYQRQMLRAVAIQDPAYLEYMAEKHQVPYTDELQTFIKQMKFYSK